ncbi:Anoctamin-10 [Intoshia linei]|uniref:Anoctamin n=1 Tax=Intoshia linei TaxID=1819745 RepID=A0A177AZM2_9BILA|nr:Anoctamin-10 [Intoshia linei]
MYFSVTENGECYQTKKLLSNCKEKEMFDDGFRCIDIVIYKIGDGDEYDDNALDRNCFIDNLKSLNVDVEEYQETENNKIITFYKLHATWELLCREAEYKKIHKPIQHNNDLLHKRMNELTESHNTLEIFCSSPDIIEKTEISLTYPYKSDYNNIFHTVDADNNIIRKNYFNSGERNLLLYEVLERIDALIKNSIFDGYYAVHEVCPTIKNISSSYTPITSDKQRLKRAWANWRKIFNIYQPLDLVRKYFGEKIGFYFTWLQYYTLMLIPLSIIGFACFIYGIITSVGDIPSNNICFDEISNTIMCPKCPKRCGYFYLKAECKFAKLIHIYDNYATLFYACFVSIWATIFCELWKRKQNVTSYRWRVHNYSQNEKLRVNFQYGVKYKQKNIVTNEMDVYLPFHKKICFFSISYVTIVFLISIVLSCLFGVIVYRIVVIRKIYQSLNSKSKLLDSNSFAKLATSVTAGFINLFVIVILEQAIYIYKTFNKSYFINRGLTIDQEKHRTDSAFLNSYTYKMYMFQFINFYAMIFYIAFLKAPYQNPNKNFFIFQNYELGQCEISGCMVDVTIQIIIVMVGKQIINSLKQLFIPFIKSKFNRIYHKKVMREMSWIDEFYLPATDELSLFPEYLEMVIQYGFIVMFSIAFPLAGLCALINNFIETRLDAKKMLYECRRPIARKAQSIGAWNTIINNVTYAGIIINACLIAFTSDIIPKIVYQTKISNNHTLTGYIASTLVKFDVKNFLPSMKPINPIIQNVTECSFRAYQFEAKPGEYENNTMFWEMLLYRILFVVIFENAIAVLTLLVRILIPDLPSKVRILQDYEKQQIKILEKKIYHD